MKCVKWIISNLEEIIIGALLILISCSIMAQVIMRYVFNSAMPWPEEVSRYAMVIMCFMSIGFCVKRRCALKIDTVVMFFPAKVQTLISIICDVMFASLMLYLLYGGYNITEDALIKNNVTPALGIKLGNIYTVSLFAIVLSIVRLIQVVVQDIKKLCGPSDAQ